MSRGGYGSSSSGVSIFSGWRQVLVLGAFMAEIAVIAPAERKFRAIDKSSASPLTPRPRPIVAESAYDVGADELCRHVGIVHVQRR